MTNVDTETSGQYPSASPLARLNVPKGALSGPQLAGWSPSIVAKEGLGCSAYPDQMIPVADGISLVSDLYLPKAEGRYPAVVCFSAYSKELQAAGVPMGTAETGSPPVFTDRGYAHLTVSRRGMGKSQGESQGFFHEQDALDLAEVIAWTAKQPWCDGQVVLFGTSYYACVQPQVACLRPPALRGFFAVEITTDMFRDITMFGGAPQAEFMALWLGANFNPTTTKLHVPAVAKALASHILNSPLKKLWWPQVQKRMVKIMKGFEAIEPTLDARDYFAAVVLDSKTRQTSVLPEGPTANPELVEIPFVVVQNPGSFNLHQFGAYDLFGRAATDTAKKRLIIGPAEYELPAYHYQLEALAFFDHLCHGSDNGYEAQAPVRYWTEGSDDWRSASAFPLPNSERFRLYLNSNGADGALHNLVLSPGDGSNRWAAVPMNAVVTPGFDDVANQLLSFDYPIDQDIELTGPVVANLKFSCNEIDSHIVARLSRIDRSGRSHQLSLGSMRPAIRTIDEDRSSDVEVVLNLDIRQPLSPGDPVILRFSLTPQPVMLRGGEKLRLDIGSRLDLVRSDVSHGRAQFDMQVPPYYSRNTLHYGPETYIELHRAK